MGGLWIALFALCALDGRGKRRNQRHATMKMEFHCALFVARIARCIGCDCTALCPRVTPFALQ